MTEQTEITKQPEPRRARSSFFSSVQFFLSVLSSALLIAPLLFSPAQAQGHQKPKQAKKAVTGKARTAGRPALPGAQQCEGALEVVPRTQLTFMRKRRPAPVSAQPHQ